MSEKQPSESITLRLRKADGDLLNNMSAVVRISDDIWVASDEKRSVERLRKVNDRLWKQEQEDSFDLSLHLKLPPGTDSDPEIDIEGMDYENNFLWIIGSHSAKRKKTKTKNDAETNIENLKSVTTKGNRFVLARFAMSGNELASPGSSLRALDTDLPPFTELRSDASRLTDLLKDDLHIGPFLSIPSKDNGFDIEGLAVFGNRVFIGLRGPVLRGIAIVLEIEVEADENDPTVLKMKTLPSSLGHIKKHFLDLGGLGVRDLCFLGSDLLVLAGPTMAHDGTVAIFRWKDAINTQDKSFHNPEELFKVPYKEGKNRAEGLTVFLQEHKKLSLLVIYDSPSKEKLDGNDGLVADIFEHTLS